MDEQDSNSEFKFHTAGEQLKAARLSQSLSIEDIAEKTRVPQRHLHAIEANDYSQLPGRTYALGFAKAYASAVGLSEGKIAAELANELTDGGSAGPSQHITQPYDVSDLDKLPSWRLMWISVAVGAFLLLAGFGIWRAFFFPATEAELQTDIAATADTSARPAAAAPPQTAAPSGEVVFTAQEDLIWVKFYDGSGKQLMQKQMALGEQYTVPVDADNPQIWTGRPDALAITIGGRTVPPLGTSEFTIKDVPVSARALIARPATSPDTEDQAGTE